MKSRLALLLAIAAAIPACGGSVGTPPGTSLFALPGSNFISARGGTGTNGWGGYGNYIEVDMSGGGDINILRTGAVNATAVINHIAPSLGQYPRTIDPALDETLIGADETNVVFLSDNLVDTATGLWVKAGATLNLDPNDDEFGNTSDKTRVWLSFSDGIYIQGTVIINPATAGPWTADLDLDCSNFVIAPGGKLIVAGAPGEDAGDLDINCRGTSPDSGSFVNFGLIDDRGGDGADGGDGGYLDIYALATAFNAGTIDNSGGTGTDGYGGSSDDHYLYAEYGTYNNGTMLARGGDGTLGGGNGSVYFYLGCYNTLGATTHSGTIDWSGGNCNDVGNGGNTGYGQIESYSGSMRLAGPIRGRGGNGGPNGGNGGWANYLELNLYDDYASHSNEFTGNGLFCSSAIDMSGGDGESGGDGGYVYVQLDQEDDHATTQGSIWFVGYQIIDGSGGDGTLGGGDCYGESYAGYFNYAYSEEFDEDLAGNFRNEVPWLMRGGSSEEGAGGDGGILYIDMQQNQYSAVEGSGTITNLATLDVSGGDGLTDGGSGGSLYLNSSQGGFTARGGAFRFDGDLLAAGGDGENGGNGGLIDIYTEDNSNGGEGRGEILINGTLDTTGGDGSNGYGGDGGNMVLYGHADGAWNVDTMTWGWTQNGSTLSHGGNGTTSAGNGGNILYEVTYRLVVTGAIDSSGGQGGSSAGGDGGSINITNAYDTNPWFHSQYRVEIGSINSSGGSGDIGGNAGTIMSNTYGAVSVHGNVLATGGSGVTWGGDGSMAFLVTDGPVTVTGGIDASGGGALGGSAGNAGPIGVEATLVTIGGDVSARGGSTPVGFGGDGAPGQGIQVLSTEDGSQIEGVTLDASGGVGGLFDGTDGVLHLDGAELEGPIASF